MIYLDSGATSFRKPPAVPAAVIRAMKTCASPGRGGYRQAAEAAKTVYTCRQRAAELFLCKPNQVVFTTNCTHGLNIAIRSLIKPGDKVLISGFEHNAVTRTLAALGADILIAARNLFDWDDSLESWEEGLKQHPDAAVFTHVSNVFGYQLPICQMAKLCKLYNVPFILDAAQSAGTVPVDFETLGAEFIAMPGHKGLLGPQGTGILICGRVPDPMFTGGTGTDSILQKMPEFLPERMEAGTANVPGIAGLSAGIQYILKTGVEKIGAREHRQLKKCVGGLCRLGIPCFAGPHQASTVSIVPQADGEEVAEMLAEQGVAVRAGLHCAPLAHESAGTLNTGTVRISFGIDANDRQTGEFLRILKGIPGVRM